MKLGRTFLVAALLIVAAALTAIAQQKGKPLTTPRTSWGDPDLQGIWTNETITPFERPAALANKPFLTAAEAADLDVTLCAGG